MRFLKLIALSAAFLAILWSCEKEPATNPDPVDDTPKELTLDASSFDVPVEGKALTTPEGWGYAIVLQGKNMVFDKVVFF